jgi:hypothetical protein
MTEKPPYELTNKDRFRVSIYRDVDAFIEKLDSTIKFFTGLEASSSGEDCDDDFVPFI